MPDSKDPLFEGQAGGTPPKDGQQQQTSTPPPTAPNYEEFARKVSHDTTAGLLKELGVGSIDELKLALGKNPGGRQSKADDSEALKKKDEIIAGLNDQINQGKVDDSVLQAIFGSGHQVVDIEIVKTLLKTNLRLDKDGRVVVLDASGGVRYNQKGDRMSVSEHLSQILTDKPYLVKQDIKGGMGLNPTGGGGGLQTTDNAVSSLLAKKEWTLDELQTVFGK